MIKYIKLLRYEFKNLVRDKMTLVMLVYPLMLMLIGAYVIPAVVDRFGDGDAAQRTTSLFIIVVFAAIAPFIGSVLLGFSLLDNRDENTLDTIRVTPISLRGYVVFKSIYAYILGVNGAFWILYGTRLLSGDGYVVMGQDLFEPFTIGVVLTYALISSLFTPVFALFLAAVAKNKIEGFAYMKATGMIILVPVLVVLEPLHDWKQYFLGIMPTFWPIKGMLVQTDLLGHADDLPLIGYSVIGILFNVCLIVFMYKIFERKVSS